VTQFNSIHLIRAPGMARSFYHGIETTESRMKSSSFQIDINNLSPDRRSILSSIRNLSCLARHNRDVTIVCAWHGTSLALARQIAINGFANVAKLDDGWFGGGMYFTTYPEYALRYCRDKPDPCLIMCYLILFNPYPVTWEDAKSTNNLVLEGKTNYKNFGCHYVPVTQYGPQDYRPPAPGKRAEYDEIVIFQENHILPYALISLVKM